MRCPGDSTLAATVAPTVAFRRSRRFSLLCMVLASQRMAGRPPAPSIRVVRFGDQHRAESIRAVLAQEQVQFIQALEVKDQRAVGAVDLEAEEILAPGAKRAGLQRADRAAAEL